MPNTGFHRWKPAPETSWLIAKVVAASFVGAFFVTGLVKMFSREDLEAKFNHAPGAYRELAEMAADDLGTRLCITIGRDQLLSVPNEGEAKEFRSDPDGGWRSEPLGAEVSVTSALHAVGLSEKRYSAYLQLLHDAGAERVSHCRAATREPGTDVLVYRSGLAVSGCVGRIVRRGDPDFVEDFGGDDYSEVTRLPDGWKAIFTCT